VEHIHSYTLRHLEAVTSIRIPRTYDMVTRYPLGITWYHAEFFDKHIFKESHKNVSLENIISILISTEKHEIKSTLDNSVHFELE